MSVDTALFTLIYIDSEHPLKPAKITCLVRRKDDTKAIHRLLKVSEHFKQREYLQIGKLQV